MILPPELFTIKQPAPADLELFENKQFNDVVLYSVESGFHSVKVVENEVGRFLNFNNTYQAGFINHEFYHGNLPYINYFLLPCLINPEIKKILLIGLGTGKVLHDFIKLLPDLEKIDVVDIDPTVIELARTYFGFEENEKINIHLQDGRVFARTAKEKYDLIITDIAGDEGIPYRFVTREFLLEIQNILNDRGILISNLFGSAETESSENIILKAFNGTFKSVFKNVGLFKCDYSDKIFYKTFFDMDYRILDTANMLFLGSNGMGFEGLAEVSKKQIENFERIGIKNLNLYVQDFYRNEINSEGCKVLLDGYEYDSDFYLENFNNYVKNVK